LPFKNTDHLRYIFNRDKLVTKLLKNLNSDIWPEAKCKFDLRLCVLLEFIILDSFELLNWSESLSLICFKPAQFNFKTTFLVLVRVPTDTLIYEKILQFILLKFGTLLVVLYVR